MLKITEEKSESCLSTFHSHRYSELKIICFTVHCTALNVVINIWGITVEGAVLWRVFMLKLS